MKKSYEVIQESGDVIFVPSLWYHQVVNLEDSISINHNWFNGSNISTVFKVLQNGERVIIASLRCIIDIFHVRLKVHIPYHSALCSDDTFASLYLKACFLFSTQGRGERDI